MIFNKARDYAFRLLKFRMRSEEELRQRLKRKKFDQATIEKVIQFLKEKDFIDDREFARAWVADKIKRPLGIRRIEQELKTKGINKEIFQEALATSCNNYDEAGAIRQLAVKRLERLKGLEPRKVKSRLYSYLLRRGFSPEIVFDIITQLKFKSG
mgnify:FL=1